MRSRAAGRWDPQVGGGWTMGSEKGENRAEVQFCVGVSSPFFKVNSAGDEGDDAKAEDGPRTEALRGEGRGPAEGNPHGGPVGRPNPPYPLSFREQRHQPAGMWPEGLGCEFAKNESDGNQNGVCDEERGLGGPWVPPVVGCADQTSEGDEAWSESDAGEWPAAPSEEWGDDGGRGVWYGEGDGSMQHIETLGECWGSGMPPRYDPPCRGWGRGSGKSPRLEPRRGKFFRIGWGRKFGDLV